MTGGPLFHEQNARQRIAALVDPGSFTEFLPPPERLTSPYLAQLGIPVSLDDGVVIGSDIGAYGGMGILSTCCDFRVMTEHGRLGISGPIVIEKWMGKKAYDSANRALVWKTSGGKTKYLLGDADALVHDSAEAVREAVAKFLTRSSAVTLKAVKARHKQLQQRLKRFGQTTDPDAVWKGMGVRNIEAASLASGPEFATLAKRGK